MSLLAEQALDIKPSENVWDAIAADIDAVTAGTNGTGEASGTLEQTEGKENIVTGLNGDASSGEVDPQSMVDLEGSELRDDRHRGVLLEKHERALSPVRVQINSRVSVNRGPSIGPQGADGLKAEPDVDDYSRAALVSGKNSSLDVRAQLFSDSTDEDEDSDDGEKQTEKEDNVLGKRSRSPEGNVIQSSGKKPKSEHDVVIPPASTLEGVQEYVQHALKAQDQRHRAEWIDSQAANSLLPPGFEKLHRVFTSLNTACGFLQKQQVESSWQNVKQALQQLSGTYEVLSVEDVQRLAQLCPRNIVLSSVNGEGDDATFHIELYDPSDPKSTEQLGMPAGTMATDVQRNGDSEIIPGRQISDTEARLIVERRQKAFQLTLAQLAQQLQSAQTNADASDHGKHTQIHPALQRHPANDGHHPMGPAILALPTQNLVLTPPPLVPQQLQPSFISISNGYHGLPFPIQVQPPNAYAFAFPQQQANNYAGYQLSSIPSTSQPSPAPSHNGSHRPMSTPPLVIDLTEPAGTPEPASFYHAQALNKSKRRRSRNWDTWEVLLLVQAKKSEWERSETAAGRDRFETSGERWKRIEKYLKDNRVIDRDAAACRTKWESLLSDYKAIKDWNRKPGNAAYNSLTPGEKRAATLPPVFTSGLLDLMDTFQGKSTHVTFPSMLDSLVRGAISGGAVSGGDGSGAEESGEALPPGHDADVVHGSTGKRKEPGEGSSPLVAAFDRMAASLISIEKGRDERSERLLALENRKYELERNKFELQARKLEIEREDRKGLVRVLGNLAGAFHRMADKM